ncbi:MAG: sigma-70 family RNA polymerase sigma factor [Candidatus Synoicihabitans palmerolidicus]|nr:sigma-70 family RNA polymerase sigma factor [Candidatus Synoicihabitans palmerolidicus]
MEDNADAAIQLTHQEELEILAAALRQLPDRCREVMLLRYLKGHSYKQIANLLQVSTETVKTQIARGTQRCVEHFAAAGLPSRAVLPFTSSDSSATARYAAEQIARRDAGWTDEEAAEFALWRANDPRHKETVQRMDATLALLCDLPHAGIAEDLVAEADALERDAHLAPRQPSARVIRWWRPVVVGALGLAATLLV